MAVQLKGVTTHGKGDTFKFDPRELAARFSSFTGREKRDPEHIKRLAHSMAWSGQQQAITYRKAHDGGPIPITGHNRILAGVYIIENRLKSQTGVEYGPDNLFLIRGEYRAMNDVDALFATFLENDDETRQPLNDVDYAHFIQTVSDTTGMTDAQIAEKLGKSSQWVCTRRKVIELDHNTQQEMIAGNVPLESAVTTIASIEPEKRKPVIEQAKKNSGSEKVTDAAIKQAAAELGTETAKPMTRSDADFKAWLKNTIDTTPAGPEVAFLQAIVEWRAGRIETGDLDNVWVAVLEREAVGAGA